MHFHTPINGAIVPLNRLNGIGASCLSHHDGEPVWFSKANVRAAECLRENLVHALLILVRVNQDKGEELPVTSRESEFILQKPINAWGGGIHRPLCSFSRVLREE